MNRTLPLAGITVLVFIVTVAILLFVLPGPHAPTDYLVIGAVATLLCLLLLYVLLVKFKPKS
jgi:hypothetical protein